MKIVLLGANGRTGRQVLSRALVAGGSITALVRAKDSRKDVSHERLEVVEGDVCEPNVLDAILPGHDVVISTLGPRRPTKAACAIYSESATAIVKAMQETGVRRLLVTSTALIFPISKFSDYVFRWIARNNVREAGLMEESIRSSSLEWTIARTGFLTTAKTTDYRFAEDVFPEGGGYLPFSTGKISFNGSEATLPH